jgi:SAM-dependent methyltransferase
VKRILLKLPQLKPIAYLGLSLYQDFHWNIVRFIKGVWWYLTDLYLFVQKSSNPASAIRWSQLQPVLINKTKTTPVEPIYFLQDSWAAGRIFEYTPSRHVDIGSYVKTVGIISQFVPTTFVDIRPIEISLPGLTFKEGSILDLPFADNSVESLSSICVIEHIGLGRYGDPIDPEGTEKAAAELQRVLATDGHLLVSVPVDKNTTVYFNAHRAFTRKYVLDLFTGLDLVEEKYIYGKKLVKQYYPQKGFGTGL